MLEGEGGRRGTRVPPVSLGLARSARPPSLIVRLVRTFNHRPCPNAAVVTVGRRVRRALGGQTGVVTLLPQGGFHGTPARSRPPANKEKVAFTSF